MINPKSLVSALHSHWEVMIALTTLSREYPAFSSDMVLEEIAKAHTTKNQEEHEALLRQLIGTELLSLHSRSNTLEIHPLVRGFAEWAIDRSVLGVIFDKNRTLLEASETAPLDFIEKWPALACRYGFAVTEHQGWRLLPAVWRYLDLFQELAADSVAPDHDHHSEHEGGS